MPRSDRHIHRRVLLAGVFATLLVLLAYSAGLFDRLEGGLYDLRAQKFQHFMPPPTDKVVHLDIDDAALEAVGAWPWPRALMADMVDEMSLAKAKVIAFDVLYAEPQEKQWKPIDPASIDPSAVVSNGQLFELIDHDGRLAESFRNAGNVLVPASLLFSPVHLQSTTIDHATILITNDLEMPLEKLAAKLQVEGYSASDVADVRSVFYATIRHNAAALRIERELTKGIGPSTRLVANLQQPQWTTAPSTSPATSPATRLAESVPPRIRDDEICLALLLRLFPHIDPTLKSPESRLIAEAYEQVLAKRAFLKLGTPAGMDAPAFVAAETILPVSRLLESAASTGFVDYPTLGDGTARRLALVMEYGGERFLHISLRIACQMLEVKPSELQFTPTTITIPAGTLADGTPRSAVIIPVRTITDRASGGTVMVPFMMNIPFFGPRDWWGMYDPQHPDLKKQHVSLAQVYGVVSTRQKLLEDASRVDDAVIFLLRQQRTAKGVQTLAMNVARANAYSANRPAPDNIDVRTTIIDECISLVESTELERSFREIRPEEASEDQKVQARELPIHMANLRAARIELPKLAAQLAQQRSELHAAFAGKAVIIGWTSVALIADAKATAIHPIAPGVVIHGVIVNAILTGELWRALPPWLTVLAAAILGLTVTLSVARISPVRALIVTALLLIAYTLTNCVLLFDYGNVLLPLGTPLIAMVFAWAGATITRLIIEARERARITRRFATYVDPDIVNYFLEVRDETMFSGQRRDTTVVFTDLEGFTKLSNQLGEEIVPLLNDFMGRAVAVIKQHRGLVNKFLGDGILFFFNAPKPNATYIPDAVDAILDLQVMMLGFNKDLAKQNLPNLRLRAGVTTGRVIAGDAGTKDRADYTVIGDLVNLASRLESANKYFGTSNLVTESTVKGAGDRFLFRPIGVIRVVGMESGVMAFETIAWMKDASEQQKTIVQLSQKLHEALASGDPHACLSAVNDLEKVEGSTKLSKTYREICEPHATGAKSGEMQKEIVLAEK